ncbi:MAG: hypothetical protein WAN62_20365, partial [Candidatus Acidiferrum sp.]
PILLPTDGGQASIKRVWTLPSGESDVKGQFSSTAVSSYRAAPRERSNRTLLAGARLAEISIFDFPAD